MRGDRDLEMWNKETIWHSRRVRASHRLSSLFTEVYYFGSRHPLIAIGASCSAIVLSLSVMQNASADTSSRQRPVEEVSVSIVPSNYNQHSALITGLTPLSKTGAERVVAEMGCNGKGDVEYTLLSGYKEPDGTRAEVNTSVSGLPNPCSEDFTITQGEEQQVLAIAKAAGLLEYQRN